MPISNARDLAGAIPKARLVQLRGSTQWVYYGDNAAVIDALNEFLDGMPQTARSSREAPGEPVASSFRTILFTDLVGHTEMMSRLGDERGRAVLREHENIRRNVLKQYGGTEVKTMGDGFMASFGSVTKAVECAIALQRAFADREGEPLNVRVGLNAGEPIEDGGDLFGATVILASRIAAKAGGAEILVSDNVRSLSAGKRFLFADRGEFTAKGISEPVPGVRGELAGWLSATFKWSSCWTVRRFWRESAGLLRRRFPGCSSPAQTGNARCDGRPAG